MSGVPDRRVVVGAGVGIGLLGAAAVGFAWLRPHRDPAALPVSHGALQVQVGKDDPKAQGSPALRCFVDGKFAGALSIEECARRNGVSSKGLDVGLAPAAPAADPAAGIETAGGDPGLSAEAHPSMRAPPAAAADSPDDAPPPTSARPVSAASTGDACLRAAGGGWRVVGRGLPLGACVHTLFAGRCVEPGEVAYGRSGPLTLRLVPGRVESSDDGRRFTPLMAQNEDCSLDE